jgi:hypothetical protein
MFKLYYLIDQTAANGIDDAKTLQGSYDDQADAQAQAVSDGVSHYSIEQLNEDGYSTTIVFIV